MAGRWQASVERTYKAPRELVWAIVSDTNRVDRAVGLAVPRYEWLHENGKSLRLAKATDLGVALEWIEPPYQWAEGHFVRGLRRFRKGPVDRGGFEVTLEDVPGGQTKLSATVWVEAPWIIGLMQKTKFSSGIRKYVDAIEELLQAGLDAVKDDDSGEPAVARARRILAQGYVAVASGPRTPVNEQQLAARIARAKESVPARILERIEKLIRERPDDEVSQVRPFEVARTWNEDKREVLRSFLRATEAGLFELQWQVNCPTCKVGASVLPKLDGVGQAAHCGACEIDYEVDFAQHVEAVFPCATAVRPVVPTLYCASSPAFLPHVFAQLRPDAKETQTSKITLPLGEILLRTLWVKSRRAEIEVLERPAKLTVVVDADRIVATPEGKSTDGTTELVVMNQTDDEVALLLERSSWSADAVLGTVVASLPEFAGLFATEAPAAGVELKVGYVALLFSDLTGSTALYEKVGDAKAFAIVEEHFKVAEVEIGKHGGGIVKTMGDAVMASFATLSDAVAAGIAMVKAHDARFGPMGLGIKVGVFGGPCLAVRANDRLDYFGTTVNVSARLQAQAGSSEVVIAESALTEAGIPEAVGALGVRRFGAKLKGIAEEQKLVAIVVPS